jgi:hypothetical protein
LTKKVESETIIDSVQSSNIVNNEDAKNESGFARDYSVDSFNNPIDEAFKRDFEIASATVELNYLAYEYLDAWKMEWNNIMSELKKQYEYVQDKKAFNNYKETFEDFVGKASELEWIDWSDTSVEPGEKRTVGTGAKSASIMEEAQLYKRQVLYLIDKYYNERFAAPYSKYLFIYKGNGADLEQLGKY